MKERDFDRLMLVAIVVLSILMMHSIITTAEPEPDKICETGEDVYVNMEFVGCTDYHQSPANTWTPKSE